MSVMMECGHAANANQGSQPVCAICFLTTPTAQVIAVPPPDLTGRIAKCGCGSKRPSDSNGLAFFEYKGPDSRVSNDTCKHCRYALAAHDPVAMSQNVPNNRRTVVEQGKCPGFEPHGAFEFDSFYCGCRGWD